MLIVSATNIVWRN